MPARDLDVRVKEDKVKILASVDLFRFIPPAALDMLAEHVKIVTFHAPEKVVIMGTEGDAMYVIVEGFLDVYIYSEAEKKDVRIGTLSAGEFFGEMALLTGKPRSATVIAATDVVAYEITRDAMMPLVNTYPEILETISRVTAERQLRERYFLENMHQKEVTKETQHLTDEILTSIMNFFGLVRDTVTHRRRGN
jgi:CRP-like cAMP-binding protein